MLKDLLINQVIPQILYLIITTILGLATYYLKKFLDSRKNLLETQKEELIQKIGIDKYNRDVAIAKQIILAVEQMGREYDWAGAVKHAKATDLIAQKTGLTQDEIFNIIKATVGEFNKDKKTDTAALPSAEPTENSNRQ